MKKNILGIILFLGIALLTFVSAWSSSTPQLSQYGISTAENVETSCTDGTDFIMQIEPFGCTPAVVRTDLLEETNVPVFCKLAVTKINPLVNVNFIESVSITGNLSPYVSGVAFYPAKSSLNTKTALSSSILENIGYVVINLKKQSNASAIPKIVSGDLTASIKYDIDEALGLSNGVFFVPELNDEEWEEKKSYYQFWKGKGYLKVDNIEANEATISLYGVTNRISSVTLKKGETSNTIYIPGVNCNAGVKLKLADLENPTTRAQLIVNNQVIEVGDEEKFLDNKCIVKDISKNGLVQKVTVRCQEDEKTNSFDLLINPKLLLNIDGVDKKVGVGEYIYDDGDKGVYLGYIGTKGNSEDLKDLFVYLVSMPKKTGNLSESEISSLNFVVGDLLEARQDSVGIIDEASDLLRTIGGLSNRLSRYVKNQQKLFRVNYGETGNVFGKQITVVNYAGSKDAELGVSYKESYENAKTTYESIRNQFASESFSDISSYGEQAIIAEIDLAYSANQKNVAAGLCEEFENNYPDSLINPYACDDVYKLSTESPLEKLVVIDGRVKSISLESIYEPTFEEYGVNITVVNHLGKVSEYPLTKDKIVYLGTEGGNYVQLVSIKNDTSAQIKMNIDTAGVMDAIKKEFGSDTITLQEDVVKDFAGYSFTLNDIRVKKSAKISLISNINDAGTKANFSFKIGIEQRAIKLSPEEIKDKLDNLNDTIKKWEGISENLNELVVGLKTSCLATGAILITKNFIAGLGGAGIARQYVMRGTDGWFEKCTGLVGKGTYGSVDTCLANNSAEINKDVETLTKQINEQNEKIKELEKGITTSSFLSDDIIDNDAFMQKYSIQAVNEFSNNNAILSTIEDPAGKGTSLNKSEIISMLSYTNWKNNYYTTEQMRNIEMYSNVLSDSSSSDNMKKIAQAELYAELSDIKSAAKDSVSRSNTADELGVETSDILSLDTGKDTKKLAYTGLTLEKIGGCVSGLCLAGESANTPVAVIQTYPRGDKYIILLENSAGTSIFYIKNIEEQLAIYNYNTMTLANPAPIELAKIYFERYSSYQNNYKNPKLSYYETEPYKGLPAIVPFDLDRGWYAGTKQTLPVGGNIRTYDASGKVNSFYLCNVGADGNEEFFSSGYGDDDCTLINIGTGQPYNQIGALSDDDAKKYVNCALNAIEQAANFYPATGKVQINTACGGSKPISIGEPAVDVPEFTCQDFMSPDECMLLFNLCDPVICPSSRCDFGGAYPVSDVAATGIIGSLALCLPNYKEGILIPVCLTGIKAGIDSLLSVQKSYRDCLQEALDTGKMIGICDEIYSIYLCDFIWKQALPLADIVIPKLIESLLGQNVRGGGEYMSVQNSLDNTEKATSYFTNYYGLNAKEAFLTRAKEVVQSEVCSVFVSGVAPSSSDLLDSLTAADSPSQYYGNFEEISLTTATTPALSHYKVFYHIYAGENSGAYYQVYLKGSVSSSYYQDTSSSLSVASGYINAGSYATETKDFTGTAGYDNLCISVNGVEECGFRSVTTDFALNYVKDKYISSQANVTGITKQSECISGTASLYSILNLNLQSAAESLIDPAIYTQGIVRVCATTSPGKTTDPNYDNQDARWINVGYCDDKDLRCWIDTESVEEVIKVISVEEDTLESLSEKTIETLQSKDGSLTDDEFASEINKIEEENDFSNKIILIDSIFEKTFWSHQKANLLLLKGDAYYDIFSSLYAKAKETVADTSTTTSDSTSDATFTSSTESETTGETSTEKISYKIFVESSKLLNKEIDSLAFVRTALSNAGTGVSSAGTGVSDATLNLLINDLEDNNFIEINTGTLQTGDVIILGKDCSKYYSVGIWGYPVGTKKPYYSNLDGKISEGTINNLFSISYGIYVYKAYRYVGDQELKTAISRSKWNLDSAITRIKTLTDNYFDNKDFVDELILDGLFTEAECKNIRGPSFFGGPLTSGMKMSEIENLLLAKINQEVVVSNVQTSSSGEGSSIKSSSVNQEVAVSNVQTSSLSVTQNAVLSAVKNLNGKSSSNYENCWDAVYQTYRNANVGDSCVYSDVAMKSYNIANEKGLSGNPKPATISTTLYSLTGTFPTFAVYGNCKKLGSKSENEKLSLLKTGDLISYAWRNTEGHSAIFIEWKDESSRVAYLFDWNGVSNENRVFRYYEEDLSDDKHPVYVVWTSISNDFSDAERTIANLPVDKQEDFIATETPSSSTESETTGEPSTEKISYKIFVESVKFLDKQIDPVTFVRTSLSNAGTGIKTTSEKEVSVATLNLLINDLELNKNFVEVKTGKLQVGDVVFIGKGCTFPYSVGIFGYPLETKYPYYTNLNGKVKEETTDYIFSVPPLNGFNVPTRLFIYKAYRYVGDQEIKIMISRTIWDLDSAIQKINSGLTGSYSDNKQFVDDLILDGVLTQEQCKKILPPSPCVFFCDGMKMSKIKNLLLTN